MSVEPRTVENDFLPGGGSDRDIGIRGAVYTAVDPDFAAVHAALKVQCISGSKTVDHALNIIGGTRVVDLALPGRSRDAGLYDLPYMLLKSFIPAGMILIFPGGGSFCPGRIQGEKTC